MRKTYSILVFLFIGLPGLLAQDKAGERILGSILSLSDSLKRVYVPDSRVALWEVLYNLSGNEVQVRGVTTQPEAKEALIGELSRRGYDLDDKLEVLPNEKELGGKTYGIVNLSVCNLRERPDFSSEMTTQGLLGMPLRVLQHDGWYRVQLPDGYISWVHRAGVHPVTETEWERWNSSEKIVVTSHYGFVYSLPDVQSQTVSDIVAGNRFKWEGTQGDFYKVGYPDGRLGYLPKSLSQPEREWRRSLKQDASSIIRTAFTMMGIPYLWAGASSKGVDCSGFVRTILFMHDIIMPRDASQQAYVGEHLEIMPEFNNLIPGDLLFFGSRATPGRKERISHVAIYLGNKRFIHSQGDVRIGSLDSKDALFDEFNLNRLLFATRFLPYINKVEEINTTATNLLYRSSYR